MEIKVLSIAVLFFSFNVLAEPSGFLPRREERAVIPVSEIPRRLTELERELKNEERELARLMLEANANVSAPPKLLQGIEERLESAHHRVIALMEEHQGLTDRLPESEWVKNAVKEEMGKPTPIGFTQGSDYHRLAILRRLVDGMLPKIKTDPVTWEGRWQAASRQYRELQREVQSTLPARRMFEGWIREEGEKVDKAVESSKAAEPLKLEARGLSAALTKHYYSAANDTSGLRWERPAAPSSGKFGYER